MSDAWFEALGEPVPEHRRERAVDEALDMGVAIPQPKQWVDNVAAAIEDDAPETAQARARQHLDVTGMFRLLAYLCVGSPAETPEPTDVGTWETDEDAGDELFSTLDRRTFEAAVEAWGRDAQFDMAEEELAELLVAMKHERRGKAKRAETIDELADVRIMFEQLALVFGEERVEYRVSEKMDRLRERLPDEYEPEPGGDEA